jgi:hypothetical protein
MDSLTINSAFAASFNEGAKRAQEQRKASLISSVPVPSRVLKALVHTFKPLLQGTPLGPALPPGVAMEVLRRHHLSLDEDAKGEFSKAFSQPFPEPLKPALEAFLGEGKGRAAVAKLLRWARGRAHVQKSVKPVGSAEGSGGGGGVGVKERGVKRQRVEEVVEEEKGVEEEEEEEEQQIKIKPAHPPPTPPVVPAAAAAKALAAVVVPPPPVSSAPRRHPLRGRGCGRGRGLGPEGEPQFEHLHPSWKAKRVASSKSRKLIHKDLRK